MEVTFLYLALALLLLKLYLNWLYIMAHYFSLNTNFFCWSGYLYREAVLPKQKGRSHLLILSPQDWLLWYDSCSSLTSLDSSLGPCPLFHLLSLEWVAYIWPSSRTYLESRLTSTLSCTCLLLLSGSRLADTYDHLYFPPFLTICLYTHLFTSCLRKGVWSPFL